MSGKLKRNQEMTIKEAVLKSLEEIKNPVDYKKVYDYIRENKFYHFTGKTPWLTISAALGDFIRNGDARVKRVKNINGIYVYYLAKKEQEIDFNGINENVKIKKQKNINNYQEEDLHILLSSYLKNTQIYSKTISDKISKGKNQKWANPDMVGVKFLNLQNKISQNFIKAINKIDTFKISSYELKREINNDAELKEAFFQAVSNSSWANYSYLAAFEFSDSLHEEMERLNYSFGIGIIQIKANPFESRILFPAKFKDLDIKTIDKLCKMNSDFREFIEKIEKLLTAQEKYYKQSEKELDSFCDQYFINDSDVKKYCIEKKIPFEENK